MVHRPESWSRRKQSIRQTRGREPVRVLIGKIVAVGNDEALRPVESRKPILLPQVQRIIARRPADGNLWFTEIMQNGGSSIGRITTAGKITEFPLPSANTFSSSTTAGPDGNLWFTEIGTNNGPGKIGVITPHNKIREFTLSHYIPGSITRGPDGNLWFTEFQYDKTGTTAGKIGRITTAGKISDFPLPTSSNSPTSITFGTDHTLWFIEVEFTPTDPNGKNGKIGHLV